jgi:hypothetical protein
MFPVRFWSYGRRSQPPVRRAAGNGIGMPVVDAKQRSRLARTATAAIAAVLLGGLATAADLAMPDSGAPDGTGLVVADGAAGRVRQVTG